MKAKRKNEYKWHLAFMMSERKKTLDSINWLFANEHYRKFVVN